jgi:hypothetical protein
MTASFDEFPDQVRSRHSRMAEHQIPRYSIFWRWHTAATFVRSEENHEEAILRIKRLSANEAGEFVLFEGVNVVAVATRGILELC